MQAAETNRPVESTLTCSQTLRPEACRKCCEKPKKEFYECYFNCLKEEAKKLIDSIDFNQKRN